jgi:hypothetical protein
MAMVHLEGFIEGFEVLKLRIDKLKKSAIELDQVVSDAHSSIFEPKFFENLCFGNS